MREVLVVGVGAGDPEWVTVQAINALRAADVYLVVDKGETTGGLLALRREILERYVPGRDHHVVAIPEPARDRRAAAYTDAVGDWHERRAELFEAALLGSVPEGGCCAILVWGDPAIYDSTLRVLDRITARGEVAFTVSVVPGISSVQALAARHRIPLNDIGEPIHVTTGRRLAAGLPDGVRAAVVMLDPGLAAASLDDPGLWLYWGAYLGTPDEVLLAGPLAEVAEQVARTKAELRERHGWIMDTYFVRPGPSSHRRS